MQTRGKWADPNYKLCDRSFIMVVVVSSVVVSVLHYTVLIVVVGDPNCKLHNTDADMLRDDVQCT